MIKEIVKIDKKSFARITALIYGLIGFFTALIVAASTVVNIIRRQDFQGSVVLVTLFNVGAGLLLGVFTALLTALCGWVMGYLEAGIYNWFVKKVGGIKVEVEEAVEAKAEDKNK